MVRIPSNDRLDVTSAPDTPAGSLYFLRNSLDTKPLSSWKQNWSQYMLVTWHQTNVVWLFVDISIWCLWPVCPHVCRVLWWTRHWHWQTALRVRNAWHPEELRSDPFRCASIQTTQPLVKVNGACLQPGVSCAWKTSCYLVQRWSPAPTLIGAGLIHMQNDTETAKRILLVRLCDGICDLPHCVHCRASWTSAGVKRVSRGRTRGRARLVANQWEVRPRRCQRVDVGGPVGTKDTGWGYPWWGWRGDVKAMGMKADSWLFLRWVLLCSGPQYL